MHTRWLRVLVFLPLFSLPAGAIGEVRVGAQKVDVTPVELPVLVNGSMLSRSVDRVNTRLSARVVVVDDGSTRLALVVVDSCMLPRDYLDEVKTLIASRTSIRPDRMMISATHAHSAPACMGCLGTDADFTYRPYLRAKLVEAVARAESNLRPGRIGWGVRPAAELTALRRWIRRPDRVEVDPFGNRTVRANMHAASNWDNVTGPSGPEDPDLSFVSFQDRDGRPLAVLANFSMHYFGDRDLSSDYFGLFAANLENTIGRRAPEGTPFVGILSHGCSGDIWRRDYALAPNLRNEPEIVDYARQLADRVQSDYTAIKHRADIDLSMAEQRLTLKYRVPNAERLEWAQRIVDAMGDRLPKDQTEVYAREQVMLHERQQTEVVVQAVRLGEIAIVTLPTETYALTGLKLKRQSPLEETMVIELANGGDGYIPPPEQHALGGYNTWAARSAGLEVLAEPKLTAAALQLLERVSGQRKRTYVQPKGPAAQVILNSQPRAYWRLDEFSGPWARDASSNNCPATYETGVAYFLTGPASAQFCRADESNRAAHFAGGRLRARVPASSEFTVSLWFWNGLPTDARSISGWLLSRGTDFGFDGAFEHLGLSGTQGAPGRLVLLVPGADQPEEGKTEVKRWTWNHVALVRRKDSVRVYLNGRSEPEIAVDGLPAVLPADEWFFGGRSDRDSSWEGRLDEIAVFDRALETSRLPALAIAPQQPEDAP